MKAIWESLDKPYRAAMEQGLIYTRLGNPLGKAELAAQDDADTATRTEDPLMPDHPLSQRIADVLDLQPDAHAIEYDGQWFSWGQVGDDGPAHRALTAEHKADPQIGMLLRNRPGHVAAFLGVLLSGGTVVTINPSRGDERTRADIAALRLPLVVGEPEDLATLVDPAPTPTTVPISGVSTSRRSGDTELGAGRAAAPGVAVRMLTSGTTGPPKRIDLSYDMLARSVMGPDPERAPAPTELRRGVAIVNSPLVHIGGVFRVLQCVAEARSFVLLDRFELNAWADAVRKHRPRTVSLVPAALRTVLHSDLTASRPGEHPRRHLRHRAAIGRRCRRLHREVRHPRPDLLCRNRIRRRRRRLDPGRPPEALASQARQRRPGQPRCTAAGGRRRRHAARSRTRSACWRSSRDSWGRRRRGCGPRIWRASTRTASSGSSGAPIRRSSAAGSR